MSTPTEDLIAQLAASAKPVRRLAPPMIRALIWLAVITAIAGGLVLNLANLPVFAARAADPRQALELSATLATGIAGIIAAFHLSVPDRPRAWGLAPLPFLAAWLGLSGFGCYRSWGEQTAKGWHGGDSSQCFIFILATGVPLAAVMIWAVSRAKPLQPRLTAAVGAMGVAGLSAFLLQFFHPFNVTLLDLIVHLLALVLLILGATAWAAGRMRA